MKMAALALGYIQHIGSTFIQLVIPGKHNVCNAVAAAALSVLSVVQRLQDIQLGLAQYVASKRAHKSIISSMKTLKSLMIAITPMCNRYKAASELLANYPGFRVLDFR